MGLGEPEHITKFKQAVDAHRAGETTSAAEKQAASEKAAVDAQTQANRPNQTNAFGATSNWTQGPDGQWTQNQSFGGPMGGLANNLQGQASSSMSGPFSFGQFGAVQDGSAARDQAIQSAYGQATSRLDPQFAQSEEALRSQLVNQGLDPTSEAFKSEMGNFGRNKNDAYSSAMSGAIAQGTAVGKSTFDQNMQSRQQAIMEALKQRGMSMEELQQMQGLLSQQNFNQAGNAGGTQFLTADLAAKNMENQRAIAQQQADADKQNGLLGLIGAPFNFL